MLRYRRHADAADVRHFQWLPIERIDAHLLPAARPRVLTMHNVIRHEAVDLRLGEQDGRSDRAHATRCGAARRRRQRARDPPRRVRAPRDPAGRAPASQRVRAGRAAGGALFRRGEAVQGRGRAAGGLPAGGGRRAVGGGPPAGRVDRASAPARSSRQGSLRGPLRERRGAAGVLPARRRARSPAPQRGRVRRAVRGPRVRQGDGDERRRRVPRARGRPRGGTARAARGFRRAGGGDQRTDRGSRRARGGWRSGRSPPRRAPTRGTASRSRRWPSTSGCWREGDLHGEVQALRRARARLARGRGRGGGRRGGRRAGPLHARGAARGPRGRAPRPAARERRAAVRRATRRRGRGDLVPVLEADPRTARDARPDRLPELPPRAAPGPARPRRLQRGDPRGDARLGRLVPFRGRELRHGRSGRGRALPDGPGLGHRVLAGPREPGAAARPVPEGDGPGDRRRGAAAHAAGAGALRGRRRARAAAARSPG